MYLFGQFQLHFPNLYFNMLIGNFFQLFSFTLFTCGNSINNLFIFVHVNGIGQQVFRLPKLLCILKLAASSYHKPILSFHLYTFPFFLLPPDYFELSQFQLHIGAMTHIHAQWGPTRFGLIHDLDVFRRLFFYALGV